MRERNNLKRPTISDRIRCNDIAEIHVGKSGDMVLKNTFAALVEWAKVGLECSEAELDGFSDDEIKAIAEETKALAEIPLGKG